MIKRKRTCNLQCLYRFMTCKIEDTEGSRSRARQRKRKCVTDMAYAGVPVQRKLTSSVRCEGHPYRIAVIDSLATLTSANKHLTRADRF